MPRFVIDSNVFSFFPSPFPPIKKGKLRNDKSKERKRERERERKRAKWHKRAPTTKSSGAQ